MNNISTGLLIAGLVCIAIAGSLFLLWSKQIKAFKFKYAHSQYRRNILLGHYLLGSWPLFQLVLIALIPQYSWKIIILAITCFVFICQHLVIMWDRIVLEKISLSMQIPRKQVKNIDRNVVRSMIPNFLGTVISIAIFIRTSDFWSAYVMSSMLEFLPIICMVVYVISVAICALSINLIRRRSITQNDLIR